jgi:type II/III secretion system protein
MQGCQRLLVAFVLVVGSGPLLADEPAKSAQVQIDVTLVEVTPNLLQAAGLAKAGATPADAKLIARAIDARQLTKLLAALHDGRENGTAKVLAEPKLVTLSGRPSHFLSGGQVMVPRPKDGKVEMVPRDVGTELDILPIVKMDGRIYLEANLTVRFVNHGKGITTSFGVVPGFDEQSMRTSVELKSGQTFAIGGSVQTVTSDSKTEEKVTLVLITAKTLPFPPGQTGAEASAPPELAGASSATRTQRLAKQIVAEYQHAAAAGDKELAAKLARMALELDPLCFQK